VPAGVAVEPSIFVIFGGTGDLARRKILPALYRLHAEGRLTARERVEPVYRDRVEPIVKERVQPIYRQRVEPAVKKVRERI
jgi:glucose-6-phosphate 1-dehydrogenase